MTDNEIEALSNGQEYVSKKELGEILSRVINILRVVLTQTNTEEAKQQLLKDYGYLVCKNKELEK